MSIGLTATTIVSQWTWSATLLQSSTVASKVRTVRCKVKSVRECLQYGISGPYWYAGGATIQIIIFSILSIMLKMRAPGAKTFLQVIKARFGKKTHLVFCTFAFLTNVIVSMNNSSTCLLTPLLQVMMSLTVAGTAVLNRSVIFSLYSNIAVFFLV